MITAIKSIDGYRITRVIKMDGKYHVFLQSYNGKITHQIFGSEREARAFLNLHLHPEVRVENL